MLEPTTLNDQLCTFAETMAIRAEELTSFSGFKLQHVKRQLAIMLSLIGRDGLFDQYTRHDITHINELLNMLEWIVPDVTQKVMTAADWLLITLSVYFHDFGMLVTKSEYERRNSSEFPAFKVEMLGSDNARDLKSKLERLTVDDAERFLFQEYVRYRHAKRIRQWIQGSALGVSTEAQSTGAAIDDLMRKLPDAFRRDLGLVCESHHSDDLDNISKYLISQPYGNIHQSVANVQYAALLLRTVDLLHMTSDRTPSIAFHLISPTDPVSQREWAKQMAVRSVRAQTPRNKDGDVDPSLKRDTVEVHALFTNPDGFFALTEFLGYVRSQLKRNAEWAKQSQIREGARDYLLPWREVDEKHVEAQGFLSNRFEFSIDQTRVLDLLTGHTLYNDTRVVLRELLQNAIDAIRVQKLIVNNVLGRIDIRWNTEDRILEVQDNGTGMTQAMIEKYLLRVGSSRYQDASFQKEFPNFSPISRFGIGLLSCFMVADHVDIFTSHPDEVDGRHLALRTVHGRYLIRVLDKTAMASQGIDGHGTLVRLAVRPSAKLDDVEDIAKFWMVVPSCPIYLTVDKGTPSRIGHSSLREALQQIMNGDGFGESPTGDLLAKIVETEIDGIEVAFALRWSESFQEWEFIQVNGDNQEDGEEQLRLATCIEGVRVESGTPGFTGNAIYAIANARGSAAPRTNVARSAFEAGPELQQMLSKIYRAYMRHLSSETQRLTQGGYSVTWAARETAWLLTPLLTHQPASKSMLTQVGREIPLALLEDHAGRRLISVNDLEKFEYIWTMESELIRSAEILISEIPSAGGIEALRRALAEGSLAQLPQPILCSMTEERILQTFLAEWNVDCIIARSADRRLDLRWSTSNVRRWINLPVDERKRDIRRSRRRSDMEIYLNNGISIEGLGEEIGIRSSRGIFLRHGTKLNSFLLSAVEQYGYQRNGSSVTVWGAIFDATADVLEGRLLRPDQEKLRKVLAFEYGADGQGSGFDEFCQIADETSWRLFDPGAWVRSASSQSRSWLF